MSTKYDGPMKGTLSKDYDPTGRDIHTAGAKMDADKPLAGLVLGCFARALKAIVAIGSYGAKKYTPKGWLSVPNAEERYKNALYRHLLELEICELDSESGLSHLSHACWNMLAWLELKEKEAEKAGVGIGILKEVTPKRPPWLYEGAFRDASHDTPPKTPPKNRKPPWVA